MKRIGLMISGAGVVMAYLLASTDDYYTMELGVNRPMDVRGLITSAGLVIVGLLVCWIADSSHRGMGKKGDRYEDHSRI